MNIRADNLPWPLSKKFISILEMELAVAPLLPDSGAVLSFRDPNYSPQAGGYHPVEVAVNCEGGLLYVTDFAYYGRPPYSELGKEIDFDFSLGFFQHFGREYPILSGRELFQLWQSNFVTYYGMRVYTVSVEPL